MESNIFNYITDIHSRKMLINAYNAVIKLNLVDFFKNENPPNDTGYMFWVDNRLMEFGKNLEQDGHSGGSFAWTCRNIQYYFKDPEGHKNLYLEKNA